MGANNNIELPWGKDDMLRIELPDGEIGDLPILEYKIGPYFTEGDAPKGYLRRYRRLVSSAAKGAVLE